MTLRMEYFFLNAHLLLLNINILVKSIHNFVEE